MRVELALLAVLCAAPLARARADDDIRHYDPKALAAYEEGKKLYDRGDYSGALGKFNTAAELEPGAPRWHYNRALALKKLGVRAEADGEFRKSLALDPTYKRAEIEQKLRELGMSPPAPAPILPAPQPRGLPFDEPSGCAPRGASCALGTVLLLLVPVLWLLRSFGRRKASPGGGSPAGPYRPPMDVALQARLRARLGALQASLVKLEHGFAAGEDQEARALLEQATGDARDLGKSLALSLHAGDEASLEPRLASSEAVVAQAFAKLEARFGPGVRTAQGPRIACFFCARPLANDAVRRQVTLRQGGADVPVLACPTCAAEAEAGKAPEVRALQGPQGFKHWSTDPAFDPYAARHLPVAGGLRRAPIWELDQGIPLGKLALAAAGGMVLSTVAGIAVAHALDLDGAREAFLSQAASNAVARRSADRDDRDWRDHS